MSEPHIIIASLIEYSIFRVGIREWMHKMKGIHYVGNTERDGLEEFLNRHQPQIFYLNTSDSLTSLEILSNELKDYMHRIQVAVFINSWDPVTVRKYIASGVRGLLLNSIDRNEFLYALNVLSQKGMFVSKEISSLVYEMVMTNPAERIKEKTSQYKLTHREIEVMLLLYKEFNKHEIAASLSISPRTVDAHKTSIFKKTGIKNNVGLAKFIIENGLQNYTPSLQSSIYSE